jgi:hypothetical protein
MNAQRECCTATGQANEELLAQRPVVSPVATLKKKCGVWSHEPVGNWSWPSSAAESTRHVKITTLAHLIGRGVPWRHMYGDDTSSGLERIAEKYCD